MTHTEREQKWERDAVHTMGDLAILLTNVQTLLKAVKVHFTHHPRPPHVGQPPVARECLLAIGELLQNGLRAVDFDGFKKFCAEEEAKRTKRASRRKIGVLIKKGKAAA